jgi:hypothetical protein
MINEATKGWVAGVLDFQGHVQKRNNPTRAEGSIQVSIYVDTSIDGIPGRLCGLTGTKPGEHNTPRLRQEWLRRGCGEHCPEAHIHIREVNMPLSTRWSVTGVSASIVLWNVRHYMSTSHEPWDWCMSQGLRQAKVTGRGAGATSEAVRRLYSLGWDIPSTLEGLQTKAIPVLTAAGEI